MTSNTNSNSNNKQSSITNDEDLKNNIIDIHHALGDEITTLMDQAAQLGLNFLSKASLVREKLSRMASNLSLTVQQIKQKENFLTVQDKATIEKIKNLVKAVANVEYNLNNLIKSTQIATDLNQKIVEESMQLGEIIIEAQRVFRETRSEMGHYSFTMPTTHNSNAENTENT